MDALYAGSPGRRGHGVNEQKSKGWKTPDGEEEQAVDGVEG